MAYGDGDGVEFRELSGDLDVVGAAYGADEIAIWYNLGTEIAVWGILEAGVPLEISPLMIEIFNDGIRRYGERAQSDDIIRRLEEATGLSILAPGFPAEMVDDEPEEPGYEVVPQGAELRAAE